MHLLEESAHLNFALVTDFIFILTKGRVIPTACKRMRQNLWNKVLRDLIHNSNKAGFGFNEMANNDRFKGVVGFSNSLQQHIRFFRGNSDE